MRFVHLAPETTRRAVERAGIHGAPFDLVVEGGRQRLERAVFCMPVVRDYSTTYQWLRELRQIHGTRMIAVHLRLPDDEPVWVGRFGQPHEPTTAARSAPWVTESPLGAEVVVPRPIARAEVRRIAEPGQLVGWTRSPEADKKSACICPACLGSGTPRFMNRVRAAWMQGVVALRRARTDGEVATALRMLEMPLERARGRIDPARVLSMARHDAPRVRSELARLLARARFDQCADVLRALVADPEAEVRMAAVSALVSALGPRRAFEELAGASPEALAALPEPLWASGDYEAARPVLRALAHYSDERVRAEATRALAQIEEDERDG